MEAREATQEEIEKTKSWGDWSKEPSTFPYSYPETETCYILEGEGEATDKAGKKITFRAGDWVVFPSGTECTWHIIKTIKKKYHFGPL